MKYATMSARWHFIKVAAQSAIGASSLLGVGDVLAGNLPVRPQTHATVVYQDASRLRATTVLMVDDLSPSVLRLLRPIPVYVEKDDGIFVVSFQDANINASGDTISEALEMLKDMIAFTYQLFSDEEATLSAGPRNELAALRRFVRA